MFLVVGGVFKRSADTALQLGGKRRGRGRVDRAPFAPFLDECV